MADPTDELLMGMPDRMKVAEETGILWDGTAIVVELSPQDAAALYWLCYAMPHSWNERIRRGIANLMDGAPSIFDRYGEGRKYLSRSKYPFTSFDHSGRD